ncbi:MAG: hypothetical protein ACRDQA_05390 [Nocardioidaceae bacterium]
MQKKAVALAGAAGAVVAFLAWARACGGTGISGTEVRESTQLPEDIERYWTPERQRDAASW